MDFFINVFKMSGGETSSSVVSVAAAKPDRKVFRPVRTVNRIPEEILNDKELIK